MNTKVFLFGLIATAAGTTACSQQDDATSENNEVRTETDDRSGGFADPELGQLNSSLQQLQKEMFGTVGQTRIAPTGDERITIFRDIFGSFWRHFDYGGSSSTLGSISSLISYKKIWEQVWHFGGTMVMLSPINSGADSDSVIVEFNTMPTYTDSMGYYHNAILTEAYTLYGDSLFGMSTSATVDVIDSIAGTITGCYISPSRKAEFLKFLSALDEAHENATSFSDFCTRVKAKYPDNSDQITVLQTYVSGLRAGTTPAAKRAYTQQVLSQINTLISDTDVRRALRAGVNTGFASDKLWNL